MNPPLTPLSSRAFVPAVPTYLEPLTGQRIPRLDLRPAEKYGSLVALLPLEPALHPSEMQGAITDIQAALDDAEFDSSKDYIVAVGDPVLIAAAINYAYLSDPEVAIRVLRWSRIGRAYELVEVQL